MAIVGASAAGLHAARLLAERGVAVRVFERSRALRPAARTLIATARIMDHVGRAAEDAIVHRVTSFDLYANGKMGSVPLDPADVVVERSALIESLARQAKEAGAELCFDRRLAKMTPGNGTMQLDFDSRSGSHTVEADVVVGADGARSAVAEMAGWRPQPTAPLIQAEVRLPDDYDPSVSAVWFRPADTRYFYWLVPDSPTTGALGLIGDGRRGTREALDRFLALKGFVGTSYQAALIPVYDRWRNLARRIGGVPVYLVGDAAGHVKVSTVGGLVTGFRGAEVVAGAISGSSRASESALRWELSLHLLVRKVLHEFGEPDYCRLLDLTTGRSHRSLGRVTRDEAFKVLLRVAWGQPELFVDAARAIGRRRSFHSEASPQSV